MPSKKREDPCQLHYAKLMSSDGDWKGDEVKPAHVIIDERSVADLPDGTKRQIAEIRRHVVSIRRILRIHPDFAFRICYKASTDEQMSIEFDKAEYGKADVYVTDRALGASWPEVVSSLIHELLHIVVYPYARLAEALASPDDEHNSIRIELRAREEELVCALERIVNSLYAE